MSEKNQLNQLEVIVEQSGLESTIAREKAEAEAKIKRDAESEIIRLRNIVNGPIMCPHCGKSFKIHETF